MSRTMYHVTVLSNFARGYDKYSRSYSKRLIPESTYPDRFFLLAIGDLPIGVSKASRLLNRIGMPGNRLIALETEVADNDLRPNQTTGLGQYIESPSIRITGLHTFRDRDSELHPVSVEEATALSLQLLHPHLKTYEQLQPRTFSVLPIARGCQADCPFCFSRASVSADQDQARLNNAQVIQFAEAARNHGAERFVVTGGGEPGLVPHERLVELITLGSKILGKAVLITNGHHLTKVDLSERRLMLRDYYSAGLRVLAVSRHHHRDDANTRLMGLLTPAEEIAGTWQEGQSHWPQLRLRFTCVLQKGGIDTPEGVAEYLDWTASLGVAEICFKELYVSTSVESVYHAAETNQWSAEQQVPLSLVTDFAKRHNFTEVSRLPWGSPVYRGEWNGRPLQIAAYTEPSLFWERTHGVARSWNLMADGTCLASLEDRSSWISLENRE